MDQQPVISRDHPFDSFRKLEVDRRGQATLNISRSMLNSLESLSERERSALIEQITAQTLDQREMEVSASHPFHGDPEGFEQYCRVKYKLLYDHILRLIDEIASRRR